MPAVSHHRRTRSAPSPAGRDGVGPTLEAGDRSDGLSRADGLWAARLFVTFFGLAAVAFLVEATHGLILVPVVAVAVGAVLGRRRATGHPGIPGDRS